MKYIIFWSFTLLSFLHLNGQVVIGLGQKNVIYDGGMLWIFEEGPQPKLRLETQASGRAERLVNYPTGARKGDYFEGAFWTWTLTRGAAETTIKILQSPDGINWHPQSQLRVSAGQVVNGIYPLGKGWYLIDHLVPIGQGRETSLFAWAKEDRHGLLKVVGLAPMGLDEELLSPMEKPVGRTPGSDGWNLSDRISITQVRPKYRLAHPNYTVRAPEAMVLVSGYTGYAWVAKLKGEQPELKLVKILSVVTEKVLENPDQLEWAVMGAQPMPDGRVLVATRSEEAVLLARKLYPSISIHNLKDFKDSLLMDARGKAMKASLETFPEIRWWTLDPSNGHVQHEDSPQNVPPKLPRPEVAVRFSFRPRVDGNLEINF